MLPGFHSAAREQAPPIFFCRALHVACGLVVREVSRRCSIAMFAGCASEFQAMADCCLYGVRRDAGRIFAEVTIASAAYRRHFFTVTVASIYIATPVMFTRHALYFRLGAADRVTSLRMPSDVARVIAPRVASAGYRHGDITPFRRASPYCAQAPTVLPRSAVMRHHDLRVCATFSDVSILHRFRHSFPRVMIPPDNRFRQYVSLSARQHALLLRQRAPVRRPAPSMAPARRR